MLTLRKSYEFDAPASNHTTEVKFYSPLLRAEDIPALEDGDPTTVTCNYVTGGANNGLRVLCAYSPRTGKWYTGNLHDNLLVQVDNLLLSHLRRAANVGVMPLPRVEEIGFTRADPQSNAIWPAWRGEDGNHSTSGWYTLSHFAVPLAANPWYPDAELYHIREGVLAVWRTSVPDPSPLSIDEEEELSMQDVLGGVSATTPRMVKKITGMRLIPAREYFAPRGGPFYAPSIPEGVIQQGDICWIPKEQLCTECDQPMPYVEAEVGNSLDRHNVVEEDGKLFLVHPEHEKLAIPAGGALVMMPGTSRPFQRSHGRD